MNYSKPVLIAYVGCNYKENLYVARKYIEIAE